MKIVKGSSRIVLVFTKVVVKIPRVYFRRAFKAMYNSIVRGFFFKSMRNGVYVHSSPRKFLFRGFVENWNEFIYYYKSKLVILQPTYFSLFGIFNIQEVGEKLETNVDLWNQLYDVTDGMVVKDGHAFRNTDNFCKKDGYIKMIDYGSERTIQVLKKYGDEIFQQLNCGE
jgi:hypothetical protein